MNRITIEEIMDLQERGMRDFLLGCQIEDDPFTSKAPSGNDDALRSSAWRFGWSAERDCRQITLTIQIRDYFREERRRGK